MDREDMLHRERLPVGTSIRVNKGSWNPLNDQLDVVLNIPNTSKFYPGGRYLRSSPYFSKSDFLSLPRERRSFVPVPQEVFALHMMANTIHEERAEEIRRAIADVLADNKVGPNPFRFDDTLEDAYFLSLAVDWKLAPYTQFEKHKTSWKSVFETARHSVIDGKIIGLVDWDNDVYRQRIFDAVRKLLGKDLS